MRIEAELLFAHVGAPAAPRWRALHRATERWYRARGEPWSAACWYAVTPGDGAVRVRRGAASATLHSPVLARGFRAQRVAQMLVVAATAGRRVDREVQRRMAAGRPVEAWFLAAYAAAVAVTLRRQELLAHGDGLLPPYAPGYPDWDLAELEVLVSFLPERAPIDWAAASLRPLRSTVVVAGRRRGEDEIHPWDHFGGGTCVGGCPPCTCSKI